MRQLRDDTDFPEETARVPDDFRKKHLECNRPVMPQIASEVDCRRCALSHGADELVSIDQARL